MDKQYNRIREVLKSKGIKQTWLADRLGYNAPIEVYDNKYYRYSEPHYSITSLPLTDEDTDLLQTALSMLNQPANQRDEDGLRLILTQVANKIEDILRYS